MHFTIQRNALLRALTHVLGAVERKATIPILAMVRLEVSNLTLTVTATDLDREARANAPLAIAAKQDGAICAPADTLTSFVRKLGAETEITVSRPADDDRLHLQAGRARLALPTLAAADFPIFKEPADAVRFALGAPEFSRLIERTRFAISTEETRYYLNGAFLHAQSGRLKMVATDGHRLAYADCALPAGAGDMPDVIIPRATIAEFKKLAADAEGEITLSVSPQTIAAQRDDLRLVSKLVDGLFPDYARILPKDASRTVSLERERFAAALDRVSIVASERARMVRFTHDDGAMLKVSNPEAGQAEEDIDTIDGDSIADTGFNGKYLAEALNASPAETVHIGFGEDAATPAKITGEGDLNAFVVLMPLRV